MENNVTQSLKKTTSGLAIAGFVLSLIGLLLAFIPVINTISYILGTLALIFGIIGTVKSGKKALGIIAIILSIVCFVAVTAMKIAVTNAVVDAVNDSIEETNEQMDNITGDNTEKLLGKDVDIIIGTFSVTENEFFSDTKLPVTVTNKTSEKASFSIQIEAVNPDGSRISNDYIYANDLGAGQSQDFDLFTLVSNDDLAKYKAASFNIVEISKY